MFRHILPITSGCNKKIKSVADRIDRLETAIKKSKTVDDVIVDTGANPDNSCIVVNSLQSANDVLANTASSLLDSANKIYQTGSDGVSQLLGNFQLDGCINIGNTTLQVLGGFVEIGEESIKVASDTIGQIDPSAVLSLVNLLGQGACAVLQAALAVGSAC